MEQELSQDDLILPINWEEEINQVEFDWKEIKSREEIFRIGEDKLYDFTETSKAIPKLKIRDGLTKWEYEDAVFWKKILHGLIFISTKAGQGKSLLQIVLAHKAKYYYNQLIWLDHKPRKPFGEYIFYSDDLFTEHLERLFEATQINNNSLSVSSDSDRWYSPRGEIFLRNCLMSFEDFVRIMPAHNCNLPIANTMGNFFTIYRHLNVCILASSTKISDINKKRCYREIRYKVTCQRHPEHEINKKYKHTFLYRFKPIHWREDIGIFEQTGKIITVAINGIQKQESLNGLCYYDLYNSWNLIGMRASKSLRKKKND